MVIDGTFLALAHKLKHEWQRLLAKLFFCTEENIHYHVTTCILEELKSMGDKAKEVYKLASTLPHLKCRVKHNHEEGTSASECVKKLIGEDNTQKYCVVSQDKELLRHLRRIPGCPLALFSNNVLVLEAPSRTSKVTGAQKEKESTKLSEQEARAVIQASIRLKKSGGADKLMSELYERQKLEALVRKEIEQDGEEGNPNLKTILDQKVSSLAGKKRTKEEVKRPMKRVKKGPSEPNPMSMKKKKSRLQITSAEEKKNRRKLAPKQSSE